MALQTGRLAAKLGVSRQTVKNWASHFSFALTPGASATGQPRQFTEEDVQVLQAVTTWRRQFNSSYAEIESQLLDGAHLQLPLEEPQPIEEEPAAEAPSETAITLHGQYQDLIKHWRTIAERHSQELARVTAERDKAQGQVIALSREVGELTGRLHVLQELRTPPAQPPSEEPPEQAELPEEEQAAPEEPPSEEPAQEEPLEEEQAEPQETPGEEQPQLEEPPQQEQPPVEEPRRRRGFWRWLFGLR